MIDASPPITHDYLRIVLDVIGVIGSVVSAIGLGYSIRSFIEAKAAKAEALAAKNAAQNAEAASKQAAERASALARRRNLVEELDDVHHKLQLLGSFLHQQEWTGVQIRLDEVIASCRELRERWPDHLSKKKMDGINMALTQFQTIATALVGMGDRDASPTEMRNLSGAYRTALGHVSDALGEARMREERDGSVDAN